MPGSAISASDAEAILDAKGAKFVAKFSSSNDTYSVVKGEYVAMLLAERCGLYVAPVQLTKALYQRLKLLTQM